MPKKRLQKYATSLEELPDNYLLCREKRHHDFEVVNDLHVVTGIEGPMLIGKEMICRLCKQPATDTFRVVRMRGYEFLVRVGQRNIGYKPGYLLRWRDLEAPEGMTTADLVKAEAWRRAKQRLGLDLG